MELKLRYWIRNANTASVDRGPLTYALKIGEKYVRHGGTDAWPAFEVYPTTAWNYGLVLDADKPLDTQLEVKKKSWPKDNQPFEAQAAPIEIRAKAKRIPGWQPDSLGMVADVRPSPVQSDEPTETVTLIPMGAAPAAHFGVPVDRCGPRRPRVATAPIGSTLAGSQIVRKRRHLEDGRPLRLGAALMVCTFFPPSYRLFPRPHEALRCCDLR